MGIARNIANIHGGELELKDRAGGGLIVEVYFPVQWIQKSNPNLKIEIFL